VSYYVPWILLLAAGLGVSLAGFLWALAHGQFSDQERARYLPLRGEADRSFQAAPLRVRGLYGLLALFLISGLTLIGAFVRILFAGMGR
jgi:cbb3-type cytochrome oxidase maturation protein